MDTEKDIHGIVSKIADFVDTEFRYDTGDLDLYDHQRKLTEVITELAGLLKE